MIRIYPWHNSRVGIWASYANRWGCAYLISKVVETVPIPLVHLRIRCWDHVGNLVLAELSFQTMLLLDRLYDGSSKHCHDIYINVHSYCSFCYTIIITFAHGIQHYADCSCSDCCRLTCKQVLCSIQTSVMLNPNKCLFLRLTSLRCHCVLFTCACRLFPYLSTAIHPFLPPLSVLVTACCVGAPPAINVDPVMSPFGITSFLHFIYQHLLLVIFLLVLSSPRHLT